MGRRLAGWLAALVIAWSTPGIAAPLAPSQVARYFDARMPDLLRRADVAGGAVAVVQDGRTIFARGYGDASLAPRQPFTLDATLVRPGSISKVLTWIAVLQLAEGGRIDLDRDVNTYLDFVVRPAFGRPVTMRDLMTHSAGFEEVSRDLFVDAPAKLYPLGEYLRRRQPARIYPPGAVIAYSNYGSALAGYIVERVSGERYADYVRRHILTPLGMGRSTMEQPLPAALRPLMSGGYVSRSDARPKPFELLEAAPAGALTASSTDMARLMAALTDGSVILGPRGMAALRNGARTMAPGRNGATLGLFENDRNGLRIVGHDGDTLWFHSDLQMIPAERLAIFVTLNSGGNGADVRRELFRGFLDRFFPYRPPATATAGSEDAARVAGWYETSRRHEAVLGLKRTFHQIEVEARPDGTISIPVWGEPAVRKSWQPIGGLAYQEVGGQARLSFVASADGGIRYFVNDDDTPIQTFQRVTPLRTPPVVTWGRAVAIVLALTALVGSVVSARRRLGRWPATWHFAVAAIPIAFASWTLLVGRMGHDLAWRMSGAADPWLVAAYAFNAVATAAVLLLGWRLGATWRSAGWPKRAVNVAAVSAGFIWSWFALSFGALAFSLSY